MSDQKQSATITLIGTFKRETEKAQLFTVQLEEGATRDEWFPKSQIINMSISEHGDTIVIPRWLAAARKLTGA